MAGAPVVFVHGLWLHADSWGPWVEHFNAAGYEASAPGWPGDGDTVADTRANADRVAGYGLDEVVDHHAAIIGALEAKPIVVGHSTGGIIIQRLLGHGLAAAGIAIDPAPIKGVLYLPLSSLRVASIALRNPANRKRAVSLSEDQFRYGFANAVSEGESKELYDRWTIPSPGRPLFEAAAAAFTLHSPAMVDTHNSSRGPLLLASGGQDRTVPPTIVKQTRKLYDKATAVTDLKEFPDRGHSLTIDSGWQEVADAALEWLRAQSL